MCLLYIDLSGPWIRYIRMTMRISHPYGEKYQTLQLLDAPSPQHIPKMEARLFSIPSSRSQSPPQSAFVPACLRDLSMSTRATRNNDSLIPPFCQTPRDELRGGTSYVINRLVCSEKATPLRERNTLVHPRLI